LSYSNTTTGIVTTTDEWTRRVMAVKSTLKELCLHEYLWKSNTDAPKTDESHLFCLVIVTESAVDPAQTSRALSKDNGVFPITPPPRPMNPLPHAPPGRICTKKVH
ncbi:unnamed protein product, partial [Aphanomyces euteiches]